MRKELEIWNFIAEHLKKGVETALLFVAESKGSSPGRAGFKMAITVDDLCGSIGGGVMEVALVERARRCLTGAEEFSNTPIQQVHRKNSDHTSGMICSGEQTVVIRRIAPAEADLIKNCIDVLEREKLAVLRITPERIGVEPAVNRAPVTFEAAAQGDYSFSLTLGYENELSIVGGGHCALALSEMMSKMDFYISLFDDRPGLSTVVKNSFANKKIIIKDYEEVAKLIESGPNRYVVVMTIGYKYDKVVIRELLEKDFAYFGVLGSKAKMAVLIRELKDEGLDTERLDAIRTPIGLDINSRTPAEIAVSIAAEIILVKNKGN